MMTEQDIEYRVEKDFDRLDKKFMRGELSQAEYDTAAMLIHTWSLNAYANLWREEERRTTQDVIRAASPKTPAHYGTPLPDDWNDEIPF